MPHRATLAHPLARGTWVPGSFRALLPWLAAVQLWACSIDERTVAVATRDLAPDAAVTDEPGAPEPSGGSGGGASAAVGGLGGSEAPGCQGAECAPVCPEGTHACGAECVDSNSPDSCGESCAPCLAPVGGAATCEGGQCGGTCDPEQRLCAGACVAAGAPCDASCPAETHDCAGLCADDFSVNSCGAACVPCPTPSNGQATCDGVACGTLCNDGFHECNGQCLDSGSVDSCGVACAPCVAPTGGTVSCNGGACAPSCPLGQQLCAGACLPSNAACNGACPGGTHDCGGVCLSNTGINSCGSSCTPCPSVPNAQTTCNGATCRVSCLGGFHDCSGQCLANTSVNSCGTTACTACPGPGPNGQASCDGVRCGAVCNTGFNVCSDAAFNTTCNRNTFDFEGAFGVIRPDTIGTSPVTVASSRLAHTGQFSAEMIVNIPSSAAPAARRTGVRVAVCGAQQSTDLTLPTLGTFFFIDGPVFPTGSRINIGFESASRGEVEFKSFEPPPRGEWVELSGRVTLDVSDAVAIKIWVSIPTGTWTGFVYLDDIELGPE